MIVVNYANFQHLASAMGFFEVAEELNSTILEMRRYEKNYFLYKQEFNFEENLTYINRLALTLLREKENLTEAIGGENYERFLKYLGEYSDRMEELRRTTCESGSCLQLQSRIRELGQNMLLFADQLVSTERKAINSRLQQMIPMPLISLVFLVVLLGFVIFFIGEKVVRPLARITRESEAVAQGYFRRITPFGTRKNEIHHLISAINRMMNELENRQEQLIQSRKIASIGTLTSGIAHEINNPINNISLILESLVEDSETMAPEERRKLYLEAMDQSDRASEIVKNLLEFSRASHPAGRGGVPGGAGGQDRPPGQERAASASYQIRQGHQGPAPGDAAGQERAAAGSAQSVLSMASRPWETAENSRSFSGSHGNSTRPG